MITPKLDHPRLQRISNCNFFSKVFYVQIQWCQHSTMLGFNFWVLQHNFIRSLEPCPLERATFVGFKFKLKINEMKIDVEGENLLMIMVFKFLKFEKT